MRVSWVIGGLVVTAVAELLHVQRVLTLGLPGGWAAALLAPLVAMVLAAISWLPLRPRLDGVVATLLVLAVGLSSVWSSGGVALLLPVLAVAWCLRLALRLALQGGGRELPLLLAILPLGVGLVVAAGLHLLVLSLGLAGGAPLMVLALCPAVVMGLQLPVQTASARQRVAAPLWRPAVLQRLACLAAVASGWLLQALVACAEQLSWGNPRGLSIVLVGLGLGAALAGLIGARWQRDQQPLDQRFRTLQRWLAAGGLLLLPIALSGCPWLQHLDRPFALVVGTLIMGLVALAVAAPLILLLIHLPGQWDPIRRTAVVCWALPLLLLGMLVAWGVAALAGAPVALVGLLGLIGSAPAWTTARGGLLATAVALVCWSTLTIVTIVGGVQPGALVGLPAAGGPLRVVVADEALTVFQGGRPLVRSDADPAAVAGLAAGWAGSCERVALLGLADARLLPELCLLPATTITVVEPEAGLVRAWREAGPEMVAFALADERVTVVCRPWQEALAGTATLDLAVAVPDVVGLGDLLARPSLVRLRQALGAQGLFCLRLPLTALEGGQVTAVVGALQRSFGHVLLVDEHPFDDQPAALLLASASPLRVDADHLDALGLRHPLLRGPDNLRLTVAADLALMQPGSGGGDVGLALALTRGRHPARVDAAWQPPPPSTWPSLADSGGEAERLAQVPVVLDVLQGVIRDAAIIADDEDELVREISALAVMESMIRIRELLPELRLTAEDLGLEPALAAGLRTELVARSRAMLGRPPADDEVAGASAPAGPPLAPAVEGMRERMRQRLLDADPERRALFLERLGRRRPLRR